MGTPINNDFNAQMSNTGPINTPDPTAPVGQPIQPTPITPPVSAAQSVPQSVTPNIPSLANHIEMSANDNVTPAMPPANDSVSVPPVQPQEDLGMSPIQASVTPSTPTQVVPDPVIPTDDLSASSVPSDVQVSVQEPVTQPSVDQTQQIGTQVIGQDGPTTSNVVSQPVQAKLEPSVEPINITPPSIAVNPGIDAPAKSTGIDDLPEAPVIPSIDVKPIQDTVVSANVGANNIPIEQLPTADSVMQQPINDPVEPVANTQTTSGSLDLVDEIVNDIPVAPIDNNKAPEVEPQLNQGVVNYNNVNEGLNAVVKSNQHVVSDDGTTLSDLVQKSKNDAGVYDPTIAQASVNNSTQSPNVDPVTKPVAASTQPILNASAVDVPAVQTPDVEPDNSSTPSVANVAQAPVVDIPMPEPININPVAVVADETPVATPSIIPVQNATPVVEQVGPPPVITNDLSMAQNTLPPLTTNTQPTQKRKKGKSTIMMILLIIVFLGIGVVLLIVGLKLSNSVNLPFDVPFLDSFITTS